MALWISFSLHFYFAFHKIKTFVLRALSELRGHELNKLLTTQYFVVSTLNDLIPLIVAPFRSSAFSTKNLDILYYLCPRVPNIVNFCEGDERHFICSMTSRKRLQLSLTSYINIYKILYTKKNAFNRVNLFFLNFL